MKREMKKSNPLTFLYEKLKKQIKVRHKLKRQKQSGRKTKMYTLYSLKKNTKTKGLMMVCVPDG